MRVDGERVKREGREQSAAVYCVMLDLCTTSSYNYNYYYIQRYEENSPSYLYVLHTHTCSCLHIHAYTCLFSSIVLIIINVALQIKNCSRRATFPASQCDLFDAIRKWNHDKANKNKNAQNSNTVSCSIR